MLTTVTFDARILQIRKGQIGKPLEGIRRREIATPDRFEKTSNLFSIQRPLPDRATKLHARRGFTVSEAKEPSSGESGDVVE
jgi:hypothetical protein